MDKLKPCPFCGGAAGMCHVTQLWEPKDSYWGKCNFCHMSGRTYPNEAEAIAAWNTRAERTCKLHMLAPDLPAICDNCHKYLVGVDYVQTPLRYCPSCGAKVVGE